MKRCDAGKGCAIECSGECVARWDHELDKCEKRCLGSFSSIQPLKLGPRFSLHLQVASGDKVVALLGGYLSPELSEQLRGTRKPLSLRLEYATVGVLIDALMEHAGGQPAGGA
jgi:hypothetical protein